VGLYVAGQAGEPVQARAAIDVVTGVGVAGDRYATGSGHWSDPRWPDQQLTLVEAEVADELGLAPELLRRNVVTRGVELGELIGARFRIGGVELHGVRVCDPCAYLEQLTCRAGLARDLGRAGGGLRAAVLGDGRITVGDAIVVG
jgi:MOSC domain-containing protein YiiM